MSVDIVKPIRRQQGGGQQAILSNEEIEWAIAERVRGRTCKDIGRDLGVASSTVSRWTLKAGHVPRERWIKPKTMSAESLLRTMELAGQGFSARDIATIQGLHPTAIRYRLRRYARDQNWRHRPHRLEETNTRWPLRA
jgi:transposase